ncbi:MAG TPA: type IV pilus assembly protein PilM [Gaiellaceae bacterium]|nr:type IV pilus assembly protein PilM [Gaiellaceae bacterium]
MSTGDNPSVWKKEIGFGRKPKAAPAAEASASVQPAKPESTSVWKKEIGFGRKGKAKAHASEPPIVEDYPAKPKTSVWKKEISLGRKPKRRPEAPKPASVQSAAADKPASVWKKEIGFGRKAKPKTVEAPKPAPLPGVVALAASGSSSVWKKEIGFGRKAKQAKQTVEAPVAAAAGNEPEKKTSVWKKEIGRKKKAAAAPARAAEKPAKTSVWKKEIGFGRKPKPAAPAPADFALETAPASAPEPVPAAPAPTVPASPAPPAPTVSAPPAPTAAPDPAPPVTPAPPSVPAPPLTPGPASPEPPLAPAAGAAPTPATPAIPAVPPPPAVPQSGSPARPAGSEPPAEAAATAAPEAESPAEPADAAKPKRGRARREKTKSDERPAKDHNQLVGLKLGASQIAAAQVVNRGGPKVVRMARMPLQRGIVVGGELREPEELASILKTFFRKNKLPRNCVRLGISNNRIGVRTFEITGITDPKQLANAVRFRAQETLPIPLDEAVLDYRILDDRIAEDGTRMSRVLLVVAHKELVERYVSACRKAGLKLVGIDLEAFALLRALSDPGQAPGEDAAVVCVSIGHDRSTLAVSDGHLCEFTRVLSWGGASIDSALAGVLDLTPSAVVPIKHALSLSGDGEVEGLDPRHAEEARRAIAAELQAFARELVASLRFYQEQPKSLGIVEILITGGGAAMDGIAAELERLIGIPVRVADPLVRVKGQKAPQVEGDVPTTSMAVAVGLGIED